ncbi:hypothetical protein ACFU44_12300 [Nocardia rhizosphaerihabitans]|uniref:hypothetical protein n=1 Tax=Nocardia rhizosphaerihabitans TaxID=1691570 RepID=UPI0036734EAA
MPSAPHEVVIDLFQQQPTLVAPLLTESGCPLPEYVLSALAHAQHPEHREIWKALLAALGTLGDDRAALYYDFILSTLPAAARSEWEALMAAGLQGYEYRSEFARKYFAEGEARGEAKSVLTVLDARGITVPTEVRERILGCDDLDQLQRWLRKALEVNRAADLLD